LGKNATDNRILSGNTKLTGRFIQVVCTAFDISRTWVETGSKPTILTLDGRLYGKTPSHGISYMSNSDTKDFDSLTKEVITELDKMPMGMKRHVLGMLKELNSALKSPGEGPVKNFV
jgi:hypothetical protein